MVNTNKINECKYFLFLMPKQNKNSSLYNTFISCHVFFVCMRAASNETISHRRTRPLFSSRTTFTVVETMNNEKKNVLERHICLRDLFFFLRNNRDWM